MIVSQENVPGFVMLRSYYEAIRYLSDNDRLCMVDTIFRYVFESIEPEGLPPHLAGFFTLLRPNVDASVRKYAAQRSNGAKGGRPPKPRDDADKTQTKPSKNQEKDKEKEKDTDKDTETSVCAASQCSTDTGFDQFWQAYPKKRDKQRAEKAFAKAIGKTDLETMLQALEAQKASPEWKKDNGQFIPLAPTWLNGCRWEDEMPQEAPAYTYTPRPDLLPEYND